MASPAPKTAVSSGVMVVGGLSVGIVSFSLIVPQCGRMASAMDRLIAALLLLGWATGGLVGERKPKPVTPAPPAKVERAIVPAGAEATRPSSWEPKVSKEPPAFEDLPPVDRRLGPVICPTAGPCWQAGRRVKGA